MISNRLDQNNAQMDTSPGHPAKGVYSPVFVKREDLPTPHSTADYCGHCGTYVLDKLYRHIRDCHPKCLAEGKITYDSIPD